MSAAVTVVTGAAAGGQVRRVGIRVPVTTISETSALPAAAGAAAAWPAPTSSASPPRTVDASNSVLTRVDLT